ncbi:MAG: glycosyltransferase family 4 protein [Deltaproteobacteria bacterium]|nr:glycosyltransferase family 4 protein [Deltaproteobacteria bacterium]
MLTILHSESSLGWGGQENRTLHECVGLKKLGVRVMLLCKPESKLAERARSAGLEVKTHPMRSNRDISAVRYCMALIKTESVDVVNTHSGDDSFICAIAGRLSGRRPVVVRTRHLALPITSKITYSRFPHRVVTVSEHVRRYLVEDKGISKDRVVTVPTGIDLERFDPSSAPDALRAELGLSARELVVGTVAILRRKKGHHILLDAIPSVLKEVPEAVFVFAGDGPQRKNIEDRIKELAVGAKVRLLGFRSDVPTVLKGLDLFVLPTLEEALGTSFLEAAAMGKPTIGTRVGGVPEAIADGKTGLLVEPEDKSALASSIIRLLKDERLRRSMGEEGRKMVEKDFSTERMVERMLELYTGLVKARV